MPEISAENSNGKFNTKDSIGNSGTVAERMSESEGTTIWVTRELKARLDTKKVGDQSYASVIGEMLDSHENLLWLVNGRDDKDNLTVWAGLNRKRLADREQAGKEVPA